jgi:hypothetical protein
MFRRKIYISKEKIGWMSLQKKAFEPWEINIISEFYILSIGRYLFFQD